MAKKKALPDVESRLADLERKFNALNDHYRNLINTLKYSIPPYSGYAKKKKSKKE